MLRNTFFAVAAALGVAASSQASVIVSYTSAPAVNLAGFNTVTLTATSNTDPIQGFDFASQGSYGIFGAMNQVNPAGNATIFQDSNSFFPFVSADVSQDSQFKFLSTAVTVPAGFASESATSLRAVFAASSPLGTVVPFAQITVPIAANGTFTYTGQIQTTAAGGVVTNNDVSGSITVPPVPEPASIALCGLACAGALGFRRRK